MKAYRRFDFSFMPWLRRIFEDPNSGWELLTFCNTREECLTAIENDKKKTNVYEYKVE